MSSIVTVTEKPVDDGVPIVIVQVGAVRLPVRSLHASEYDSSPSCTVLTLAHRHSSYPMTSLVVTGRLYRV